VSTALFISVFLIAACGLKRSEVYICNIVKCHPPRNRTPLDNEEAYLTTVAGASRKLAARPSGSDGLSKIE